MNVLIEGLPKTVNVNGSPFLIRTNFYYGIMFFQLMEDRRLSSFEKAIQTIKLWYIELPPMETVEQILSAVNAIVWFFSLGEVDQENDNNSVNKPQKPHKTILDYDYDQGYIVSAFQQQYGIDLTAENIHWWRFKMLFNGLTDKTMIVKIMQYRGMEIDIKMTDNQKKFYREMKQLYKIPDKRTEEEKERDFQAQMNQALGGG